MRQTAFKLRVADALRGELMRSGSMTEPSFVRIGDFKFLRVNLFGKVVAPTGNGFMLDEGTAAVRVKVFDGTVPAEGSGVKVIGKMREDAEGRFVAAEIIKNMPDPEYARLRELEVKRIP